MSKLTVLVLLLALVGLSVSPAPRRPVNVNINKEKNDLKWWNEGKSTLLTSRTFESIVGKDNFVVVQFCATFSKECEALQAEYNKLAEMYSGATPKHTNVMIGKIDGWTFNSLSQTYAVKRFPTIRFFNKNDATNSDEYSGDLNADKMSEWIENLIKAKEAPKTEEKKPEEPKKEEAAKEAPKVEAATETKQPEATNTQATPQAAKTEEDVKKEFKLVLNTTLLQAQFDEVQAQLNKLSEALTKNIADNFKKVDTLSQAFESHKTDFHSLSESLRGHGDKLQQLGNNLNDHKDDIKNSVTQHAENHMNNLKDSVNAIKNKVHERRVEEPSGPGFMHNLIFMVIGGAVGAGAVYLLSGGSKKRRSMLD